ncbi:MAG TPA: adenylosuccinate synthetase [Candidatus Saccharimonadales bacterium]|nr:adenylosuccinate synthetase [Candidatus Saccharimonadales bacterium]
MMNKRAVIVTDMGYGDAGKGTMVDYLVRQAKSAVVIRHNGGAQAAHNVVTQDGRHHTFAQFGSGTFVPGVNTYLSRYMLVNPLNMFPEAEHLIELGITDAWERVSIDRDALVITPWQSTANRIRELARGEDRHGSCGQGIGETMSDTLENPDVVLRVRDLEAPSLVIKLEALRDYKQLQLRQELGDDITLQPDWQAFTDPRLVEKLVEVYRAWVQKVNIVDSDYLAYVSRRNELLVFEGAQGALLDEWQGFHPYTTWSTTTHANALQLLSEISFGGECTRLGVLRAYTTRHGAGPLVTEDKALAPRLKEYHNTTDTWQGAFRYGHFDAVAHRYALAMCGETDELAITGLDRLSALDAWQVCTHYRTEMDRQAGGEFFEYCFDRTVGDINLGVRGDLVYQTRLTNLLATCSPIYQAMRGHDQGSISDFLQLLQSQLRAPITITSFGPTAADKRVNLVR